MTMKSKVLWPAVSIAALLAIPHANGQEYPTRPVRLVNANAPGGVSDRMARSIAKAMEPSLGQNVVVENKPGGSNLIAVSEVLRSSADGYTVGQTCLASILVMRYIMDNPPFNFVDDAGLVGMMGGLDVVIAARADSPVNSIEDLVALARANPGQVAIGMTQAVANIVPIAYMNLKSNIRIEIINYKGETQVLGDMLGGTLQFGIQSTGAALPQVQAGKLKAIQVLAPKRNPAMPNVPSQSDTKVPGFPPSSFCVMYSPKAMAQPIVQKLNRSLNEAAKDKELNTQWTREGLVAYIGTSVAETSAFVKELQTKWNNVAKEVDITKYR